MKTLHLPEDIWEQNVALILLIKIAKQEGYTHISQHLEKNCRQGTIEHTIDKALKEFSKKNLYSPISY